MRQKSNIKKKKRLLDKKYCIIQKGICGIFHFITLRYDDENVKLMGVIRIRKLRGVIKMRKQFLGELLRIYDCSYCAIGFIFKTFIA